jgi:hypothetical protein
MQLVFEDVENMLNCFNSDQLINNSGQNRITNSGYANQLKMLLVYWQSLKRDSAYNKIIYDDVEYEITLHSIEEKIDGKYIIPIGVNQSPREWMSDFYDTDNNNFKNILDILPKKYFNDIQKDKAYLMIDNSYEGYHSDEIFDYLYESATSRFINPKNIIYVTGNLIIEDRLEKWKTLNKGKVPIQVIPYPHFEFDIGAKLFHYRKHDGSPIPTTATHVQYKNALHEDNVKLFNFLNKKPRNHRLWMYSSLQKWNLLDKGIISMNPTLTNDAIVIDFNKLTETKVKEANDTLPIYAYDDNTNDKEFDYYMYNFNQKACLESWISVISETHFEDTQGTIFLSEKTFKTIACQSPFMILGNSGSLKKLKELGYFTYHDIIDESYDELSSIHRINAIIDELRKWEANQDKYQHFRWLFPILEHNVEVMKYNSYFKPPAGFNFLYEL